MRQPGHTSRPRRVTLTAIAMLCGALIPPVGAQAWTFTDVTAAAGLVYQHGYTALATRQAQLVAGGVAAGDYDRDGYVDLYVVRGSIGANRLYRNRGDGTFEERAAAAGLALTGTEGSGPTFADVDGDGWLDLLVLGVGTTRPSLFRNNGDGTFTNVTTGSGLVFTRDSISAAFGDYDRDGDLDLFVTHWADQPVPNGPREHLWRNDGGFTFTEVGYGLGIVIEDSAGAPETTFDFTFTPNFVDLDADGWLDIALSADFFTSQVFRNLGGTFIDVTDRAVITDDDGMGGAIADYDRDGDLDWFVSSIFVTSGNSGNRLYRNRGDGTLEDATTEAGVREGDWGWGSTFADLDNDGWVDLFHVNGYGNTNFPEWQPFYEDPARLFHANGDGTFSERAAELGVDDRGRGLGVVAFDYDRDGDLDLFIANNEGPPKLFRNDGGNAFAHLTVKLQGQAPNTEGIGARVLVTTGGLTQLHELRAGSNYVSQDPAEAHFGLGATATVDTVEVRWPSGGRTTLSGVAANQVLTVIEPPSLCGNGIVETGPLYGEDCDQGAANGTPGSCCQVNCLFRPTFHVCRGAAFACDAPETCTGGSDVCPADVKSTGVCRPAAGICDVAESCDGIAEACPPDLKATGTCRPANGACDVAESCDGTNDACPADGFADTSVVCRGASDVCDVAETCSGTAAACPDDGFAPPSVECRPAAAICDAAEFCTGDAAGCPADVLSTAVCRPAAGGCDVAESCDGVALTCPTDDFLAGGTICRADPDICHGAGICTGTAAACPPSAFDPPGTPCQNDGNPCTVDACDGAGACTHVAGNAGAVCRFGIGDCDPPEHCDGSDTACPTDVLAAPGFPCRVAAGVCDVAETCTGTDADCPADALEADTVVCRAAVDACDLAETCTGTDVDCPADALAAADVVCRPASDACDVAETCTGTDLACPADAIAAAGTVCRPMALACDVAEQCDGTSVACPADVLAADGAPCNDGVACNSDACENAVCVGTRDRTCLDDFQCYRARRTAGASAFPVQDLADRFEGGLFDVRVSKQLCSPAAPPADPIRDPATHLQSFQIVPDDGARHVPQTNVAVTNRLGTLRLDTRKADLLLLPTSIGTPGAPDPDLHGIDHFKCYQVRVTPQTPRFPRGVTLDMTDGFTSPAKTYSVVKPRHLCTPVGIDGTDIRDPRRHLLCYVAKAARGEPKHVKQLGLSAQNVLGGQILTTQKEEALCLPTTLDADPTGPSVARLWDETILSAIRIDIPRPTVHARNLFHLSAVMWDAWRAYGGGGRAVLTDEFHASDDPEADRAIAISFAAYRMLSHRYALSVNPAGSQALFDARMAELGLDPAFTDTVGDNPAAVGNRIAAAMIAFGATDGANEAGDYDDPSYVSVNAPLVVKLPGTTMADPSRFQRLALDVSISQNGIPLPGGVQGVIGMRWNQVAPFALTRDAPNDLYIDPGPPPTFGGASDAAFKSDAVTVLLRASRLTPDDGVLMDTSPGAVGNNPLGTNDGTGYPVNPVTGEPYAPRIVPRGDFGRVLAEFWADGPQSETPPGHWNTIANEVSDRLAEKRIGGTGPVIGDLEWDVKLYLALNGAVHDAAIVSWGLKRHYDSARPISMIRYMGGLGQSSDPMGTAYHPGGLPLMPGLIEVITPATTVPGERHASLAGFEGQIAILTWPGSPINPATEYSGVRWMRAVSWVPYQKATFVTPAFPGYTSGHSTFSRAAAEVMTRVTGSPYFPGGLGEFVAQANAYLTFERGPTADVHLQWATYYDAADQAGQSRIWGGIHIETDDFFGRITGASVGVGAWEKAERIFDGTPDP